MLSVFDVSGIWIRHYWQYCYAAVCTTASSCTGAQNIPALMIMRTDHCFYGVLPQGEKKVLCAEVRRRFNVFHVDGHCFFVNAINGGYPKLSVVSFENPDVFFWTIKMQQTPQPKNKNTKQRDRLPSGTSPSFCGFSRVLEMDNTVIHYAGVWEFFSNILPEGGTLHPSLSSSSTVEQSILLCGKCPCND